MLFPAAASACAPVRSFGSMPGGFAHAPRTRLPPGGLPRRAHARNVNSGSRRCCIVTAGSGRGSTSASGGDNDEQQHMSQEAQAFWAQVLDEVDKPLARRLIMGLDLQYPLGFAPREAGIKSEGSRKPPCAEVAEETKLAHPTKVVLVRVGEFYEALGTDAVLLIEWAGLNQLGTAFPPRVGTPKTNIRKTLDCLVDRGLSVAVCEESRGPRLRDGSPGTISRAVAGIVSPEQPKYKPETESGQVQHTVPTSILGAAWTPDGYQVVEVWMELCSYTVWQGLAEDALAERMLSGGVARPLYLHSPIGDFIQGRVGELEDEDEGARRLHQMFAREQAAGMVECYSGDAVEGLITKALSAAGRSAKAELHKWRGVAWMFQSSRQWGE